MTTPYAAVQVADGRLWHASDWMRGDEHARTLCGRTGWIDHNAYDLPVIAVVDGYTMKGLFGGADEQHVECRSCERIMRREATR